MLKPTFILFTLKLYYLRTIVNVYYYLVNASYPQLLLQYLAVLFTKAELNSFPISDIVEIIPPCPPPAMVVVEHI